MIIPPRGTKPPAPTGEKKVPVLPGRVVETQGPKKLVIPPRGTPPAPKAELPKKVPVIPKRGTTPILPSEALGAAAFNKAKLPDKAKLAALLAKNARGQAGDMHPGDRLTVLPEAASSGIHLTIKELLKQHPLPLNGAGEEFILDDWQEEDILKLMGWTRTGVFLPVGAGKTVIATLVALAYKTEINIVLIQPILMGQWVKWLNSVGNSGGAVAYQGSPKKRAEINLRGNRWWVMTYDIFKNDFEKLFRMTLNHSVTLIVDEAQAIKNSGTALWKKCNTFSLGRNLIMMTGTELNSPDDAYGYVKIKTPTIYKSYGHFERVHHGEVDFFGKVLEYTNLDLMTQNLYFQSVQRTPEEVHASKPKARYIPFPYKLAPEHQRLYDKLANEQILLMENGGKWDATTAQGLYTYCQQIVINLNKFSGNPDARPACFDVLDTLADSIGMGQTHGANKMIVWTWFKDSTRTVLEYLESLYPGRVGVAYGESNSQKAADRFENDPDNWWLVAQPLSAGAGWNPQYVCWNMVFLEVPTRTIPFRQSAGRVDRKGQKFNANIWIGQAEGTIQTSLYNNLLANDELVQRVQGNPRDLRAIISGSL